MGIVLNKIMADRFEVLRSTGRLPATVKISRNMLDKVSTEILDIEAARYNRRSDLEKWIYPTPPPAPKPLHRGDVICGCTVVEVPGMNILEVTP